MGLHWHVLLLHFALSQPGLVSSWAGQCHWNEDTLGCRVHTSGVDDGLMCKSVIFYWNFCGTIKSIRDHTLSWLPMRIIDEATWGRHGILQVHPLVGKARDWAWCVKDATSCWAWKTHNPGDILMWNHVKSKSAVDPFEMKLEESFLVEDLLISLWYQGLFDSPAGASPGAVRRCMCLPKGDQMRGQVSGSPHFVHPQMRWDTKP